MIAWNERAAGAARAEVARRAKVAATVENFILIVRSKMQRLGVLE